MPKTNNPLELFNVMDSDIDKLFMIQTGDGSKSRTVICYASHFADAVKDARIILSKGKVYHLWENKWRVASKGMIQELLK